MELGNIEESVYNCAPGENSTPRHVLVDKEFEVLACPYMFTTGCGGYETTKRRETKLPVQNISNSTYYMLMANLQETLNTCSVHSIVLTLEKKQSDSNIALHLSQSQTVDGQKFTAGMLL